MKEYSLINIAGIDLSVRQDLLDNFFLNVFSINKVSNNTICVRMFDGKDYFIAAKDVLVFIELCEQKPIDAITALFKAGCPLDTIFHSPVFTSQILSKIKTTKMKKFKQMIYLMFQFNWRTLILLELIPITMGALLEDWISFIFGTIGVFIGCIINQYRRDKKGII